MRILLDANVILTYITNREDPYLKESKRIVEMCAKKKVDGFMAFHALSVIWYVIRKYKSDEETRRWGKSICQVLTVVGATQEQIIKAVDTSDFKDFEDCLVDQCAVSASADFIVTGNIKDYKYSEVKAVTPAELCSMLPVMRNTR